MISDSFAIALAPMAGVTDLPFRNIVAKYGNPSFMVSEMIACQAMLRSVPKSMRRITSAGQNVHNVVQIAGCDPEMMAKAAQISVDHGAQCIDLNMGCPAKKIAIGSYAGAALMRDLDLAARIFESVRRAVSVPVTVKMRKGWDEQSLNALDLINLAKKYGLARAVIHGRTRNQFYQGKADWPFIGNIRAQTDLPIIANGDITDPDQALALCQSIKIDGIMVGRGTYGRPWILSQIRDFLSSGKRTPSPSIREQQTIVQEHFDAILSHYGKETGVPIARKHLGWYSRGFENATYFRTTVFSEWDPNIIRKHIDSFYEKLSDAWA